MGPPIVKVLLSLAALCFAYALISVLGNQSRETPNANRTAQGSPNVSQKNAALKAAANLFNKEFAGEVVDNVRINSASVPEPSVFVYDYTLLDPAFQTNEYSQFDSETVRSLVRAACTDGGMQVFREDSVVVVYRYRRSNGSIFDEFSIPLQDCQELLQAARSVPASSRSEQTTSALSRSPSKDEQRTMEPGPNHPGCKFKSVMTDSDYAICGIRPPGSGL